MAAQCFFIGTSWKGGPSAVHFRVLARKLIERGHRVVLFVDGQRHDVEDHTGNPAVYTWPSPRPTKLRDARFLYQKIKQYQPDCMIANFGSVSLMTFMGWLTGVPCRVAWYRTLSTQIALDNTQPLPLVKLQQLRKGMVYRMTTHIIPVAEAASRDIQQAYGVPASKCHVFLNALTDPAETIQGMGLSRPNNHSIVCVGRLHPSKGQDVLLRAVARLTQIVPDCSVTFLGNGSTREALMQLGQDLGIADRCVFAGHVDYADVLVYMATATVTAVPSRSEAFGVINIESMAVGTPVVASAAGGIPEIVRHGIDGFLVPPDKPDALAAMLGQVLINPDLRDTMSRNARQRYLDRFDQDKVAADEAAWFEGIVNTAKAARR
jgi:glycosyltransferase involved in cell wall biosynthesis